MAGESDENVDEKVEDFTPEVHLEIQNYGTNFEP